MEDLRILRDKWTKIEAEETQLLRQLTVAESLHEARVLYDAYAARLSENPLELNEREIALIDRQRRLVRLAEWLQDHPTALSSDMT